MFYNKPILAVNFKLSEIPRYPPSDIQSIILSFDTLEITPNYIDDTEPVNIDVNVSLKNTNKIATNSAKVSVNNGNKKDIGEKLNPIVLDELKFDSEDSVVEGLIKIDVHHPDLQDSYLKRFKINNIKTPSSAVHQWIMTSDSSEPDQIGNTPLNHSGPDTVTSSDYYK